MIKFHFFPELVSFVLDPKIFKNPLMSNQLFGLKVYGLLITSNQKHWKLHNLRGVFFSICFILFNITQYVDLVKSLGNLSDLMMNAPTTLLFTTTFVRMLSFYRFRDRWIPLIQEADEGVQEIMNNSTRAERKIFRESVKYARRLFIGFIGMALLTANTMCVYSFVQSFFYDPIEDCGGKVCPPPTILRSWIGTDRVWDYFYWVYVWQLYIMWLGQIIVPCWHTFQVGLMVYCICTLKIMNYQLENFGEYVSSGDDGAAVEFFKKIIERHKKIIKFVKELIDLNGCLLFIDFVVYSALLCALLFQTAKFGDDVQKIIGVCYMITMISILFMYYWHANEICLYNYELSGSLFKSDWYTRNLEFKKMFLMFVNVNTPRLKLKAVIVDISLKTFIDILQGSYSYFTILNQL